jgi:hypothetical protein
MGLIIVVVRPKAHKKLTLMNTGMAGSIVAQIIDVSPWFSESSYTIHVETMH